LKGIVSLSNAIHLPANGGTKKLPRLMTMDRPMYKKTTASDCKSTRCKAEYLDQTCKSDWAVGKEPEHQSSGPMQQSCQLEILILP